MFVNTKPLTVHLEVFTQENVGNSLNVWRKKHCEVEW